MEVLYKGSNMEVYSANLHHLYSYEKFITECYLSGLIKYESAIKEPKAYLKSVILEEDKTSTFLCIDNDEVLGAIRFRRFNNLYVEKVIGHVGYETKPSARGNGVAKFMLSWLQKNIMNATAIITCEVDNHASEKVILGCNGTYLNEVYSTEKKNYVKRFELPCKRQAVLIAR